MADRTRISAALADMAATFAAMARTVDGADMEERRQLIAHRRKLADCFMALSNVVDAGVAAGHVDDGLAADYRSRFATFRRAVSLHQAAWPTILISDDIGGYVAAGQALRVRREDFMAYMRNEFLPRVGGA